MANLLSTIITGGSGTTPTLVLDRNIATPSNYYNGLQFEVRATSGTAGIGLHRNGYSHVGIYHDSTNELKFNMNSGTPVLLASTGTIWGSGNDGSGSGLDADTVDGFHVSVAASANTIPTRNASGYLIPESWIQLNGIYGLYSPTNNAHLRPNDASYGSWLMTGSRNGWQGIEFNSGSAGNVTLMVATDSNTSGFHNNSYGWQVRWYNGTLYVGKGAYGGGADATVWDSSNAPRANFGNLMYYQGFELDANTMSTNSTGFTYANNAPFYGPIARFSTGGGYDLWIGGAYSGGGNAFYLRTRNGDAGTFNAWREIITSGNIGSQSVNYAASAGNSSTTSQIVFSDLKTNFPSGAGGGHSFASNHYSMGLDSGNGGWDSPHYRDVIIGYHTGIRIGAAYSGIRFYNNSPTTDANNDGNGDGGEALLMTIGGYVGTANQTDVVVNNNLFANVSMRSPIFYDSQNTGYYGDFASTSVMNAIRLGTSTNSGTISGGGDWGIRFANDNGWIQFGPANNSWTHIYTDKNFYFNQNLYVNGTQVVLNSGTWGINITGSAGDSTNLGGYSSARYVRNDIYNSVDAGLQVFRNIGTIDGSWPSSDHTFGLENSDAGNIVINFHRAGYTSNNLWYNGSQFRFDQVVTSTADFRAPIFYDSQDTGYYVDPNSTSRMYRINYDYLYYAPDTNYGFQATSVYADTVNSGYDSDPLELVYARGSEVRVGSNGGNKDIRAARFVKGTDTSYYLDPNGLSRIERLQVVSNWGGTTPNDGQINIRGQYPSMTFRNTVSNNMWLRHMDGSGDIQHYFAPSGVDATDWSIKHSMRTDGTFQSNGSMRAPIFYDSNDTNYYGDFAGFSRMSEIGVTNNYVYNYFNIESSRAVAEFGHVGLFRSRQSATTDYIPFSFQSQYGNHSWGQVARFHIEQSGADRPSIQFSSGSSNQRWNVGYCYPDDDFRISQNMGYRPDLSGTYDGWGTERLRINGSGHVFIPQLLYTTEVAATNGAGRIYLNGNLHIDSYSGNDIYMNYYSARGTRIYVGSGTLALHVNTDGLVYMPTVVVNSHSDNTKGYRISNTSGTTVSAMFVNSSNQLVIAAGAVDQVNLNKKVLVNGVALGVNVAPSATAGRIDASNDIVAYSSSDERLKENITPIENALDKVKSLTGVEFDWKPEYKHAHGYEGHDTGIIAQQVEAVMPSAVRTNDTGFLAVRYEKLIGLLIEGMKEQQAQIDELKAKLDGIAK